MVQAQSRLYDTRVNVDWRVRFHDHGDSIEILRVAHRKDAYQ
jgi:hypothetical protein